MVKAGLVSEGSSDACLIPLIDGLIARTFPAVLLTIGRVPVRSGTVREKIGWAIETPGLDLLIVHRDADGRVDERYREIWEAIASNAGGRVPSVPIVPVQEMEAWLLTDPTAIWRAANRTGEPPTSGFLPKLREIESMARPKEFLHRKLVETANLQGRRRSQFSPDQAVHSVARRFREFDTLLRLTAVQRFVADLRSVLAAFS